MSAVIAVLALLAQVAQANPWDGHWTWGTYAERVAYVEAFKAQVATDARANCGKPYFGTWCQ